MPTGQRVGWGAHLAVTGRCVLRQPLLDAGHHQAPVVGLNSWTITRQSQTKSGMGGLDQTRLDAFGHGQTHSDAIKSGRTRSDAIKRSLTCPRELGHDGVVRLLQRKDVHMLVLLPPGSTAHAWQKVFFPIQAGKVE